MNKGADKSGLPRPLLPFVEFATILRTRDFIVAPEQTQSLIAAVGLLGPRSFQDIHRAAVATLAPPPERREEFDALFRLVFLGEATSAPTAAGDEEETQIFDDQGGGPEPPEAEESEESGGGPAGSERLFMRQFPDIGEADALRHFRRRAPQELPHRRSRRLGPSKSGKRLDMRRALRDAVRRDGELLQLPALVRRQRRRRLLLLIDVSGSMKEQTDSYLRFAHSLTQATDQIEVFTLGTRLTRITRALRRRRADQALKLAATLVADWDGGTRLGDALQAFLSVPRFAGFSRGALVVMLSDGLERGDPAALVDAMGRLSRLAWASLWLNPLAAGADYAPETSALQALLPFIDRLGDGSSAASLCREVLQFERRVA